MLPSYRNQLVDLLSKAPGWFLHEWNIGRCKVKVSRNYLRAMQVCINLVLYIQHRYRIFGGPGTDDLKFYQQ